MCNTKFLSSASSEPKVEVIEFGQNSDFDHVNLMFWFLYSKACRSTVEFLRFGLASHCSLISHVMLRNLYRRQKSVHWFLS
jgi:hypothetical protein